MVRALNYKRNNTSESSLLVWNKIRNGSLCSLGFVAIIGFLSAIPQKYPHSSPSDDQTYLLDRRLSSFWSLLKTAKCPLYSVKTQLKTCWTLESHSQRKTLIIKCVHDNWRQRAGKHWSSSNVALHFPPHLFLMMIPLKCRAGHHQLRERVT